MSSCGVDQRFEGIDRSFEQVDQRFEQVDQRFEGVDQRFDHLEAEVRHAHVQNESLDEAVHKVAESVLALDEKLSRRMDGMETKMDRQHGDLRSLIHLSYRHLDHRVTALEERGGPLDA